MHCRSLSSTQKIKFIKCCGMNSSYRIIGELKSADGDFLKFDFIFSSSMSLFSIPRNKRFVFINSNAKVRSDPVLDSMELLLESIEKSSKKDRDPDDELDELRPFRVSAAFCYINLVIISMIKIQGFGKPLHAYANGNGDEFKEQPGKKSHSIVDLLNEHVREALDNGFDDSVAKYKGKCRFVVTAERNHFFLPTPSFLFSADSNG